MGVSFHFHTQKTPEPVTAPIVDSVRGQAQGIPVAVETLFLGLPP